MAKLHNTNWYAHNAKHVWQPNADFQTTDEPLQVVGAEGSRLFLADGTELIDGLSSWWVMCHGYNHPYLQAAITRQLAILPHIMFGGIAHEQAYILAERLVKLLPPGLSRVFYSESGSIALEIAMKIAVQYWHNQGQNRCKFVSFKHSYHGDTMATMSLASSDSAWHSVEFENYIPNQYVVDLPQDELAFANFNQFLSSHKQSIAALVIEPLAQCAGGMKFHSEITLKRIYDICKANDVLFIADELATGFYRTGQLFACLTANITPDIMCVGKALTGGMLPLSAAVATEDIYQRFNKSPLMHSTTFMANPMACAAANASLDLFAQADYESKVRNIADKLQLGLAPCKSSPKVKDVRVLGAIGVVEIDRTKFNMIQLGQAFLAEQIWIRPIEDAIYIMPPLTINDTDLEFITSKIAKIIEFYS